MKGKLAFDPAQYDYGVATPAVRQILLEWADVDWFAPPVDEGAQTLAIALFREHNALARVHMPDVFPAKLEVESEVMGWEEFDELCERVRAPSAWDWKYSVLKRLSLHHSKARAWSRDDEAQRCVALESGAQPRPGDLFVRLGDQVIWTAVAPKIDLGDALPPDRATIAAWYLSYANMDMMECIEWQLAERNDALEANPFVPLLRCYATGFLPFGLDAATVVLFAFRR
jgi:hypothetical protein